ncbi:MAG: ATP-binding cassette domain-containing protein, partial [Pseudomonadota bacterium]|nr:ATP-binding cassette domain-containing protein [Pseudomonadota bacterium]
MAIRGVTLEVGKGQIVTILGSNGAGKTTILKTISGAIEPQKGSVEFDGEAITGMEPDKIARAGIRHVPEGREVFPFLTVRENLEVGAFSEPDRKQVQRQMDRVFDFFP